MTTGDETATAVLSSREAADRAGITYRQLDYWTRAALPVLTDHAEPGSGNRRRWQPHQVAVLTVVGRCVELGARPSDLGPVVEYLMGLDPTEWRGVLFVDPVAGRASRDPGELHRDQGRVAGWYIGLEGYAPTT